MDKIKYTFLYVISVLAFATSLSGIVQVLAGSYIFGGIQSVGFLIFGIIAFIYKDYMFIEFDYAVYDGNIQFAKVINQKKRKELLNISINSIIVIASIADNRLNQYKKEAQKAYKFVLNEEQEQFFLFVEQKGQKFLIFVEPNIEFMKEIKAVKPSLNKL